MRTKTKRAKKQRAPRPRRVTPESLVARQITDFLTAHGFRYKRNQVGRARYGQHYVSYGEKGEADYTVHVPTGEPNKFYILNVETKAEKGRQSYEQKLWQQLVESMGEFYLIAKSYEPIEAWMKERGVVR